MSKRGFTLVEVVIVIFLFTLVMLAVVDLFISFNTSYSKQVANIGTAQSAAAFMNEVQRDVLQANSVAASHLYSGTTYTSDASTLVLTLPSVDASGNVVATMYDYAIFYLTGSTTYRIMDVDASSARAPGSKKLSDVMSYLTFTYNNVTPSSATNVTVDATTSATVKTQTFQTHLTQQIYLRNL